MQTSGTPRNIDVQRPLFSYRYRSSTAAEVEKSGGQAAAAESDTKENNQPTDAPEELDCKYFMNDILLASIPLEMAEDLQYAMINDRNFIPGRLIEIDSMNKLKFYSRPNREVPIIIKDCYGVVVRNPLTIAKQRADKYLHRLLFKLNDSR